MFLFLETVNLDVSDTKDVRRWWMVFALFVQEMATQVADGRFLICPCLSRPHPCPPPSLEVLDHLLINLHVHLLVRLLDHVSNPPAPAPALISMKEMATLPYLRLSISSTTIVGRLWPLHSLTGCHQQPKIHFLTFNALSF